LGELLVATGRSRDAIGALEESHYARRLLRAEEHEATKRAAAALRRTMKN